MRLASLCRRKFLSAILILLAVLLPSPASAADDDAIRKQIAKLSNRDADARQDAIEGLAQTRDERVARTLQAMFQGNLVLWQGKVYVRSGDVRRTRKQECRLVARSADAGAGAGRVEKAREGRRRRAARHPADRTRAASALHRDQVPAGLQLDRSGKTVACASAGWERTRIRISCRCWTTLPKPMPTRACGARHGKAPH